MNPDTLTADRILAMPAGAEMDELVATRVLGWRLGENRWTWICDGFTTGPYPPCVSVDLGDAGYVLDWLRERWGCVQMRVDKDDVIVWSLGGPHTTADTLPLALCRAALLETLQ